MTQAGTDARRLAYFLAVVEAGTVTGAATRLRVAQPSVSLAIRDLERDFGAPLFDRLGRRLVLNETGRSLVDVARQVIGSLASARATVGARASLASGEVVVAAPASLAVDPLGPAMSAFCLRHPGVFVRVIGGQTTNETRDLVAAADADIGLATDDSGDSGQHKLVEREIGLHEIVAVLPPDAVVSGRLTSASLVTWPLIAAEPGTRVRAVLDDFVADGLPLRIVAEVGYREATIPLVLGGIGAALLPSALARLAGRLGAVVAGLDPPVVTRIMLVHHPEITHAAAAFVDALLARCGDNLAPEPAIDNVIPDAVVERELE